MPIFTSFVEVVGCVVLFTSSFIALMDEAISIGDVRKVLEARYPIKQRWTEGDPPQFRADAQMTELDLPHLSRGLAGAKFYRTEVMSSYHEYQMVETIVMARRIEGRLAVFECRSPVFTTTSKEFIEQFRGLRGEHQAVGEEIGKLFESTTYKGSLHNADLGKEIYTVELWHNESIWRKIIVEFTLDGAVKTIELKNPREVLGR